MRHYRESGAGRPSILSVEPDGAACLLESLVAGRPLTVHTGATFMAGLNCGTVSSTAWPVLRGGCALAVTDADALRAVDDLARLGFSSGPTGAASLAGVRAVLADPTRRAPIGLDDNAVAVLLNTDGREPEIGDQP